MGSNGCINGTLAGANYSSPVPVIGLYVAGGSFVCLLMMLCDIVTGFLRRTRWVPNVFFKLNSVTLTLLSIATKLTVDLTTPMPSSLDQLSKLSGTTFICVTIGFLIPSLGTTSETESKTNLAALAIFVITVIVNICIQISTKVITLFIVEHVLILGCMLVLLIEAYHVASIINCDKGDPIDRNKELLTQGNKSLFQRVKICYVNMYQCDSQFVACRLFGGCKYSGLCVMSSSILVQAAVRSIILKQLKFCLGTSDYGWSMSPIVHIQILTVVLASSAITFRWISMYDLLKTEPEINLGVDWWSIFVGLFFSSPIYLFSSLFALLPRVFMHLLGVLFTCLPSLEITENETTEDFKDLFAGSDEENGDKWILYKNVTYLKKLIAKYDKDPPNHLFHFLSQTSPSHQVSSSMEISQQGQVIQVSPISIVLLVKIVQVSIPEHLCTPLVQALREANGIYHVHLPNDIKAQDEEQLPRSELEIAITTITRLRSAVPSAGIRDELGIVADFINGRSYSSIEDLYTSLEQLIVDMLHALLSQLPIAIFKSLNESLAEDYPKKVTSALEMLCKVQHLEALIQWSFPVTCNISTLIIDEIGDALRV